jgi:dihydrofolate reductase
MPLHIPKSYIRRRHAEAGGPNEEGRAIATRSGLEGSIEKDRHQTASGRDHEAQRKEQAMGDLVVSTYVTLDGVMQPIDWTGRYSHEDHGKHAREVLFASDALIMGRETYEIFAPAWSSRTAADEQPGEEGYVDRINGMPKFVASTTLKEPLDCNNSTLIAGDVADAVSGLKERFRGNVLMYGCGPLARTLTQHGLVDEFQMWIYPVIWGDGERLFNGLGDGTYLALAETKAFGSGVVLNTYRPAQA